MIWRIFTACFTWCMDLLWILDESVWSECCSMWCNDISPMFTLVLLVHVRRLCCWKSCLWSLVDKQLGYAVMKWLEWDSTCTLYTPCLNNQLFRNINFQALHKICRFLSFPMRRKEWLSSDRVRCGKSKRCQKRKNQCKTPCSSMTRHPMKCVTV